MNWSAAGVVAEIIGAAAVVVSLLFLAVEVRRNRSATESASVDALGEGFNALNAHLADDPELAAIWIKGMNDPDSLSDVEGLRFISLTQSYINHFTTVMKYHDAGLLPEEQWQAHYVSVHHIFNSPGGKWLRGRTTMTPTLLAVFDTPLQSSKQDGFWFTPKTADSRSAPDVTPRGDV